MLLQILEEGALALALALAPSPKQALTLLISDVTFLPDSHC